MHHILVPLDGTPAGDAIAGHAVSLAIALEARCTLLHVASSDRSGGSASIDTLADADIRHPADDAERARLERVADVFRERGVDTATALLHGTDPAYWIAEYASTHVVDLIAMSTHGRGGLERLVSGSISTEMVSRKQLPMLLVRSAA